MGIFNKGSVPVSIVARVYGKDASWVRAGCYFTSKEFKYEETGVYKSDGQRKLMGNWNIFRRK